MATYIPLINPDATEPMARMFRESIQSADRKLAQAEALIEQITNLNEQAPLDTIDIDLITEGLYEIINKENDRVISLASALKECELCLTANQVLVNLSAIAVTNMPHRTVQHIAQSAIALIYAMDDARKKG